MTRRSGSYRAPRDWVVTGSWPDGVFDPEAPHAVAHAVAIAKALEVALGDRVRSRVAQDAQIDRSTLYDILSGKTWPDLVSIANLERHLNTVLWPDALPPDVERHSP